MKQRQPYLPVFRIHILLPLAKYGCIYSLTILEAAELDRQSHSQTAAPFLDVPSLNGCHVL